MVQTRRRRPTRRPKGAGPERPGSRPRQAAPIRVPAERYPNLAAREEMDRQEHVRRARALGATRKQASRHAAGEVGGH